jgi:hypothetical protein
MVAVSVLISELMVLAWPLAVDVIDITTAAAIIPTPYRFMGPPKVRS